MLGCWICDICLIHSLAVYRSLCVSVCEIYPNRLNSWKACTNFGLSEETTHTVLHVFPLMLIEQVESRVLAPLYFLGYSVCLKERPCISSSIPLPCEQTEIQTEPSECCLLMNYIVKDESTSWLPRLRVQWLWKKQLISVIFSERGIRPNNLNWNLTSFLLEVPIYKIKIMEIHGKLV